MSITIYISLHHMYTKEQIFRDFCLWLCSSWALTYRGPFGRSMHSGWWWIPSAIDVRSVSGFISIPILHGQALRWPGSLPTVPPVNWIPIFWSLGPRKRFGAWVMGRYHLESYFFPTVFFWKPPGWYQATCFSRVWRVDFYFCEKKLSRPCVWWRIRIVAWQEINGEIVKQCLTAIYQKEKGRRRAVGLCSKHPKSSEEATILPLAYRDLCCSYELKLKRHVSAVSIAMQPLVFVQRPWSVQPHCDFIATKTRFFYSSRVRSRRTSSHPVIHTYF